MIKKKILFSKEKSFWAKYKIKIASTLFAILIWFFIVTGGTFDYVVSIPIKTPRHKDYTITNHLPRRAKIRVRGQGMYILAFLLFREGRLQLSVNWEEGEISIRPGEKDIILTGNAKKLIIRNIVEPDTIKLKIEKLMVRKVPIKRKMVLRPFPGYTIVGSIHLKPEMVQIRGPRSIINSIDSVSTQTGKMVKLKHPVNVQVALQRPDDKRIILLVDRVRIIADVQKLMEKEIKEVPVTVRNLPPHVKALVLPSHFTLIVQGGVSVVSAITAKDIVAYIDYRKNEDKSQHSFPAYIEPIPEIRFRNVEPKRFKVVLERE